MTSARLSSAGAAAAAVRPKDPSPLIRWRLCLLSDLADCCHCLSLLRHLPLIFHLSSHCATPHLSCRRRILSADNLLAPPHSSNPCIAAAITPKQQQLPLFLLLPLLVHCCQWPTALLSPPPLLCRCRHCQCLCRHCRGSRSLAVVVAVVLLASLSPSPSPWRLPLTFLPPQLPLIL